jgi:hypothetical protein
LYFSFSPFNINNMLWNLLQDPFGLTLKGLKSLWGTIGSSCKFPWHQFSLWCFETFLELCGNIIFFHLIFEKKNCWPKFLSNCLGSYKYTNENFQKNIEFFSLWNKSICTRALIHSMLTSEMDNMRNVFLGNHEIF